MRKAWYVVPCVAVGLALCTEARAQDGDAELRKLIEKQQKQLEEQARRISELEQSQMQQHGELQAAIARLSDGMPADAAAAPTTIRTKKGTGLSFYGFVRLDVQYSDSRFQDNQLAGWVLSEDGAAPPGVGSKRDQSDLTMHGRLTRLGMNLDGGKLKDLGEPDLTGAIEIDFYGGGSDSRNLFRMRKAYLQLDWGDVQLLAGQTWDLMSPLIPAVNADLCMWGAGNLGDRRPQIRGTWSPDEDHAWSIAGMAGLTGAIDGDDLDADRVPDGESSSKPTLQGRVGYKGALGEDLPFEIGIWGYKAWEEPSTPVAGKRKFDASALGLDIQATIVPDLLSVKSEIWSGENLDDVRGGILQGVNSTTGDEIGARGGFAELWLKASPTTNVIFGYSTDDPENRDLNAADRAKNTVMYVAVKWSSGPMTIGGEYLNWETDYVSLGNGTANRFVAYVAYSF